MNEKIKDFLEQAYTYSFQENRGQFVQESTDRWYKENILED